MFHTMVIQQQIISSKEWDRIYNNLDKLSKVKGCNLHRLDAECGENVTVYKTLCLADKGLNQITLKKIKVDRKYTHELKYIEIVLNPTKLLKKTNSIAITKEEDIENMYKEFEKVKILIDSNLNRLYLWKLKRIDYTRNIDMRNVEDWVTEDKEQLVSEYIKLFNKADKPSKMKIPPNKVAHRNSNMEGSFRLYNKSVTVNFYDKENERINKDKPIEDSKYILRLEIQCKKIKINSIKKQNDWDSNMLLNYLNKDIALKNLYSYYKKTVGEGDYYKLKGAEKIIRERFRKDKQEILIGILKSINKCRSIWKAREESDFTKEKFNGYLRDIRGEGINPVTLAERTTFNYLPSAWSIKDADD